MTISLGGAPGPRTGGLTQMGARAVQDRRRRNTPTARADATRAGATEDDACPTHGRSRARSRSRRRRLRSPPAKRANTGPQPTDGNARADTGVVRGQGFGLSSAGGGGGPVQVDVTDFCCPDYLAQLVTFIQRSWDQNQGVVGSTTVKFTIARDGTIQMPSGGEYRADSSRSTTRRCAPCRSHGCRRCRPHFKIQV